MIHKQVYNVIGWLLFMANSRPPAFILKQQFYSMKSRICERFGVEDGYDVQHFHGKVCFGCNGTGIHYYGEYPELDEWCWRCDGSGMWKRERWVLLKRYRIGDFKFHKPDHVVYEQPEIPQTVGQIEGFIEHKTYRGHWHDESVMLLALLFDWKLLWGLMSDGWVLTNWPRWWGPMVQIKHVIGITRNAWQKFVPKPVDRYEPPSDLPF